MYLVNTNNINQKSTFKNSVINSLPSFDGLWFPDNIKPFNHTFFDIIDKMSFHNIAYNVLTQLVDFQLHHDDIKEIINEAFNFPVNIKKNG